MAYLKELPSSDLEKFIDYIPGAVLDETLDDVEYDFFGIIERDEGIGIVICRPDENADVYIRFIYIVPNMRNRGIMNRSLDQLKVFYWGIGYEHFYIRYLPYLNPELASYCNDGDFEIRRNDSAYFDFRIGDITEKNFLDKTSDNVVSLASLPARQIKRLYNQIQSDGIQLVDFDDPNNNFLMDESVVYMSNGNPFGLALLQKNDEDALEVLLFYIKLNKPLPVYYMLTSLREKLINKYPPETRMEFFCRNPYMTRLLEKFLNIKGNREVVADFDLNKLDEYIDYQTFSEI